MKVSNNNFSVTSPNHYTIASITLYVKVIQVGSNLTEVGKHINKNEHISEQDQVSRTRGGWSVLTFNLLLKIYMSDLQ